MDFKSEHYRRFAFLAPLILCLGGCGASSPNLVVIGNSITWHIADPSIGWNGNWGMAASAEDRDFAHVTAASLHLPVTAFNLASLERLQPRSAEDKAAALASVNEGSIVVVELGDNAVYSDPGRFREAYNLLLADLHPRALYCLSTFWEKPWLDQIIQRGCEAYGGTYVYIGDIYRDPSNPDYKTVTFADSAVQGHPHDWSMAQIADRVVKAVGGR
jgi:hypothetical protein